jgi:F-type H+-transporting ATPase subunit b
MQPAAIPFLVPNGTFFVELIIVFVILFITTKYIVPPLTKAMEDREADIRDSLEAAEAARSDAAAADDERRATLEAARQQAREVVAAAQAAADAARADAQARGHAEYERIVGEATTAVEAARAEAIGAALPQLDTIVMGVVERVIGRQVDMGAHRDLVQAASARLTAGPVEAAGSAS